MPDPVLSRPRISSQSPVRTPQPHGRGLGAQPSASERRGAGSTPPSALGVLAAGSAADVEALAGGDGNVASALRELRLQMDGGLDAAAEPGSEAGRIPPAYQASSEPGPPDESPPAAAPAAEESAGGTETVEIALAASLSAAQTSIIWRAAHPVRVATDIPAELLPAASRGGGGAHPLESPSGALSPSARSRAARPKKPAAARAARADPPAAPLPFGAWYLPRDAWGKPPPPHDGVAVREIAHLRDPAQIVSASDLAAEKAAARLAFKVRHLYSARVYREHLRQKGARLPAYLGEGEAEPPARAQRRGSGRGAYRAPPP